jgi:hypothetical protein
MGLIVRSMAQTVKDSQHAFRIPRISGLRARDLAQVFEIRMARFGRRFCIRRGMSKDEGCAESVEILVVSEPSGPLSDVRVVWSTKHDGVVVHMPYGRKANLAPDAPEMIDAITAALAEMGSVRIKVILREFAKRVRADERFRVKIEKARDALSADDTP